MQKFFKAAAKGGWFWGIMLPDSSAKKRDVRMGKKSGAEGRKTAPK